MRLLLPVLLALASCSSEADQPAAVPSPTATLAPGLVLLEDGLLADARLPFGTSSAEVLTTVADLVGAGRTAADVACPEGPRTSYTAGGLTVLLAGTRFVGWAETSAARATADGVQVGIALGELQRLRPDVQVSEESLEAEFLTGDLGGFLTGRTPESTVTSLHAGEVCTGPR